jgi:hypothetical protein
VTPVEIDRLQELIELLKYRKPPDLGTLLIVGMVVLAALILFVGGHIAASRRRLRAANSLLEEILAERRITAEEERTIRSIARAGGARHPVRILTSLSTFDESLDLFLRQTDGPVDRIGVEVLRYKLGFHRLPPGWALRSTRGLRAGHPLLVRQSEEEREIACSVVGSEKDGLLVAPNAREDQRALDAWSEGVHVTLRFWRPDDGEYRCRTGVLNVRSGRALIDHCAKLRRQDRRSYFRIPFRSVIRLRPEGPDNPEPPDQGTLEGLMLNVSAGGMCVRMHGPLHWERIQIAVGHAEPLGLAGLGCRVLRKSTGAEGCDHALEFEGLNDPVRDRLVRGILRHQARDLAPVAPASPDGREVTAG